MSELNWTLEDLAPSQQTIYHTQVDASDLAAQEEAIEAVCEKAISFLNDNVTNDSRFLLTELDLENKALKILVTDESMSVDGDIIVSAKFTNIDPELNFQLLVHESLATACMMSVEFMNYSLLAVFTTGARQDYQLV